MYPRAKLIPIYLMIMPAAFLLTPNAAQAEFTGPGENEGLTLGAGLLVDYSAYEGADDLEWNPVPYIAYDWENAHIGVDGIDYTFFNHDNLEVTVLAEPRWSFTDPDDSPLFEGIERKTTIEAGAIAKVKAGSLYASAQIKHDVLDIHNGYEARGAIGVSAEWGRVEFGLSGGVAYRDEKLNDYMYGVRADEASATLAQFSTGDTFEPFAQAEVTYMVDRKTALFGFANARKLSDEVKASPLVGRGYESAGGIAILRRF